MAKTGQNAMIKIWVLKVLRKICGGKNENIVRIHLLFNAMVVIT